MNWNDIKNKIGEKCLIKEIDPETIEFSFMGKEFRIHRFEIPDGFLVNDAIKQAYNGKLVLYKKIAERWRIWH